MELKPIGIREEILNFEEAINSVEGSFKGDNEACPLKHSFADGIYVREIFIPKGMYIVGKIHKHSHPNFLMSGTVNVLTEGGGAETLIGPMSMISVAGTKRMLYAKTDLTWITVHSNPTNTQDLGKLEEIVIADSFEEYEKFISGNYVTKGINYIKKLIKKGGIL